MGTQDAKSAPQQAHTCVLATCVYTVLMHAEAGFDGGFTHRGSKASSRSTVRMLLKAVIMGRGTVIDLPVASCVTTSPAASLAAIASTCCSTSSTWCSQALP